MKSMYVWQRQTRDLADCEKSIWCAKHGSYVWVWGLGGYVGVFMAVFPAVEGYVAGSKGLAHELVVSVRCKRRASHTWFRNAEG